MQFCLKKKEKQDEEKQAGYSINQSYNLPHCEPTDTTRRGVFAAISADAVDIVPACFAGPAVRAHRLPRNRRACSRSRVFVRAICKKVAAVGAITANAYRAAISGASSPIGFI